ncbi:protein of unknown function [Clostridium sp. DSM 8431]|uniref:DUF4956 domain-containing protein n=1 Tax=Clostridium sp. DSM 8431 TaxID=1761781 RepID=UPI0008F2880E|nr:DUF4956 domain-containing protein [Clostridium sp. DSM 8431]SFU48856.1 protein of unknown function [Clostridium sp. DSM 8431]
MLESLISSTNGESFTLTNTLIIIFTSIVLGLIISIVYMENQKKEGYSNGFALTLVMLPVIISIIILLVGNNVARAFSLAGAFSIIRFRSAPGDPKDISYVFFTLAVGLACGMGYVGYAILFTVIICLLLVLLNKINFGKQKGKVVQLKITIPEDLNYDDVFDDILENYCNSWYLQKIKTRDFGSLFELNYQLILDPNSNQKKFIDELRTRNGNLNIAITLAGFNEKIYN